MNPIPVSPKMSRSLRSLKVAQAGVGLIEILIAVLVLSIGLLGLAALQTRSLGNTGSSTLQTLATLASYSIVDAMRLDKANAIGSGFSYNVTLTGNACPTVSTTATLAANQLSVWCNKQLAPLGATSSTTGKINCAATGLCTVTIQFDNSKATGGRSTQTVVTQAGL